MRGSELTVAQYPFRDVVLQGKGPFGGCYVDDQIKFAVTVPRAVDTPENLKRTIMVESLKAQLESLRESRRERDEAAEIIRNAFNEVSTINKVANAFNTMHHQMKKEKEEAARKAAQEERLTPEQTEEFVKEALQQVDKLFLALTDRYLPK